MACGVSFGSSALWWHGVRRKPTKTAQMGGRRLIERREKLQNNGVTLWFRFYSDLPRKHRGRASQTPTADREGTRKPEIRDQFPGS
jgi:hypothetical protein